MTTGHQLDRRSLHFVDAVKANFSFLTEHGFQCADKEPTLVQFKSRIRYINVFHGRKSFEVSLEIGPPMRSDESPYSMSEIVRLVETGKADEYRDYSARTADDVAEGVRRLAACFRRYIDTGILEDAELTARLEKQREVWKRDFAREVEIRQARGKIDASWYAKDYAKVAELLRPLRDVLTPTELQKLEYAERKKNSGQTEVVRCSRPN